MTANIYDQHKAAFANVSAFVVLKGSERVATVAIKFPKDGAGRLYAYVHFFGVAMVRGFANGYGYDKRSAACASAVSHLNDPLNLTHWSIDEVTQYDAFRAALAKDGGTQWDRALEDAGFTVLQAV